MILHCTYPGCRSEHHYGDTPREDTIANAMRFGWSVVNDLPLCRKHASAPPPSYDAIDAVNFSKLKLFGKSPKHYIGAENVDTANRVYLRAIHEAVLEPAKYAANYAVCDVRRNARDKAYQEWLAEHPGAIALTQAEHGQIEGVRAAILAHVDARDLIERSQHEVTLAWDEDGTPCKGRADIIGPGALADLKTYGTTDEHETMRLIQKGYAHVQLAHYRAGARANGHRVDNVYVITAEDKPPFDVAVFDVTGWMEIGESVRQGWLASLRACQRLGEWPGRHPRIEVLDPPDYLLEEDE